MFFNFFEFFVMFLEFYENLFVLHFVFGIEVGSKIVTEIIFEQHKGDLKSRCPSQQWSR